MLHKTKIDLRKWFFAVHLLDNKKISARQLAKDIQITKDSACFMVSRIRGARQDNPILMEGIKAVFDRS
jgi:hypothetical protein